MPDGHLTLSAFITRYIRDHNITVHELSRNTKIAHSTLDRWIAGKSMPTLTQLCICDDCGRNMAVQRARRSDNQLYVICHRGRLKQGCTNNHAVHFDKLERFMEDVIQEAIRNPQTLFTFAPAAPSSRLPALDRDIEKLTKKIDNWFEIIGEQDASNRVSLQSKIDAATEQRKTLRAERARLETSEREQEHQARSRMNALNDIQALGILNFWAQPITTQNQLLRKVLGGLRIVCRDGEPVGLRRVE